MSALPKTAAAIADDVLVVDGLRKDYGGARVVEPLITLAKVPSLANHRLAFNRLRDRDVVLKLFKELGPRYQSRPGGYTRILKMGFRVGDNAPMAFVELLDRPEPVAEVEAADKTE